MKKVTVKKINLLKQVKRNQQTKERLQKLLSIVNEILKPYGFEEIKISSLQRNAYDQDVV